MRLRQGNEIGSSLGSLQFGGPPGCSGEAKGDTQIPEGSWGDSGNHRVRHCVRTYLLPLLFLIFCQLLNEIGQKGANSLQRLKSLEPSRCMDEDGAY